MMRGEPVIAESAREHGVSDGDILHAYANPIWVFDLDEAFTQVIEPTRRPFSLRSVWSRERRLQASFMPCDLGTGRR